MSLSGSTRSPQEELLQKTEELVGDVGPRCFVRQQHVKLIELLKQLKDEMPDELQRAREDYSEAFVINQDELKQWYEDLQTKEDGPEKVEWLKSFFEHNLDDNKTSWFYSLYMQFVVESYQNQAKNEINEVVYSLDKVKLILNEALRNTNYDFTKSHEIWNRFYEFSTQVIDEDYSVLKNHYLERLGIPHKTLDETFSNFSSFVTKYNNDNYSKEMLEANKIYSQNKNSQWDIEFWEMERSNYEKPSQYWIDYMNFFASKPKKQRRIEPISALFERAVHEKQQTDEQFYEIWIIYINVLYELQAPEDLIFSTLKRFLRKYPDFEAPYIELFSNIPNIPFPEKAEETFEITKSRAEFLIKSSSNRYYKDLIASLITCEYKLLMKGFETFVELLLDHINTFFIDSLEKCKDAYHTVERLCISIMEELGEYETIRDYLRKLTSTFGTQAEIWLLSHEFEKKHGDYKAASKILFAAITRSEILDWPERIFEEAMAYERVHGSVESYRQLRAKIHKKSIEIRFIREQVVQETKTVEEPVVVKEKSIEEPEKRKAEEDLVKEEDSSKKQKLEQKTRDREHLTLSVQNIPLGISEIQIRKFFKDCGQIRDLHLVEKDGQLNAKIEFSDDNGANRALTKDHKKFHGSELRAFKAYKTTVWITNFPPSYDSKLIEKIFAKIGPVASVRFPSLKFNSQRRFCYVEYLDSKDATKSVAELNDKEVEGYKLVVKISDPESKTARAGAVEEGRELYVSKLDFFRVTVEKVKQLFGKYGNVERVNLPLSKHNKEQRKKHDGYGFVTFSTPEEAQAALELNLVTLEGRTIEVSISKKKSERVQQQESKAIRDYLHADNVVSLLNLPDTINAAQVKDFCSVAGPVEHVVLEPEHEGAIVEFENPKDAGQASLKLDGKSFGNYTVQVGTVHDLRKATNIKKSITSSRTMVPSSLRRKQAFQKTSTSSASSVPETALSIDPTGERSTNTADRTNADFRAMLLGKK